MAAPSTRPSTTNSRTFVDEQTSPSTLTGGTTVTPKPCVCPSVVSVCTSPERLAPKVKS